MTQQGRIIVRDRRPGPAEGFTIVTVDIDGGASGEYAIATILVGTQQELEAIREMSDNRMVAIEATRPGGN